MSGEVVSSHPIRSESGRVVATLVIREHPDGTRTESVEPLDYPAPSKPHDWDRPDEPEPPVESPADRIWRER